MPPKPNTRNWSDVQTAIAAVSIVTTLGLWNLFSTPAKVEAAKAVEPVIPPTEPPVEQQAPGVIPQVKIMFTQVAPQQTTAAQPTQQEKKKKKNNNGGSTTQTKTS